MPVRMRLFWYTDGFEDETPLVRILVTVHCKTLVPPWRSQGTRTRSQHPPKTEGIESTALTEDTEGRGGTGSMPREATILVERGWHQEWTSSIHIQSLPTAQLTPNMFRSSIWRGIGTQFRGSSSVHPGTLWSSDCRSHYSYTTLLAICQACGHGDMGTWGSWHGMAKSSCLV